MNHLINHFLFLSLSREYVQNNENKQILSQSSNSETEQFHYFNLELNWVKVTEFSTCEQYKYQINTNRLLFKSDHCSTAVFA